MSSLKDMVADSDVESLHAVVESSGNKYLCFTNLTSDMWVLCATDGTDMWRLELNADDLQTHRDIAEVNTMDAYLARIKSAFTSGDMQVSQSGIRATLHMGQGRKSIKVDLFEAKSNEKKTELSNILFRLAEKATDLEMKLEKASNNLDSLKAQKAPGGVIGGGIFGDGGKKKVQPRVASKQTGMSIINPGTRKRKAARGVQYDDDED